MDSPTHDTDTTPHGGRSSLALRRGDEVIVSKLQRADNMWTRMKGLLGRRDLDPQEGLWITPCNSIHMFFMRFALDAVFVDAELKVVRTVGGLRPWRMARGGRSARSVFELPQGTVAAFALKRGDRLSVDGL